MNDQIKYTSLRAQFADYFTALGYTFDSRRSKECVWLIFDGKGKRWSIELMLYKNKDHYCFMASGFFEEKDMYKSVYPDGVRVNSMDEIKFLYTQNNAFYKFMAPGAI